MQLKHCKMSQAQVDPTYFLLMTIRVYLQVVCKISSGNIETFSKQGEIYTKWGQNYYKMVVIKWDHDVKKN